MNRLNVLGERIREMRRSRGMDIADLSRAVGMSVSAIQKLETGERGKTLEKLPAIARALGCRIDDLFPPMDNGVAGAEGKSDSAGGFAAGDGATDDDSLDCFGT